MDTIDFMQQVALLASELQALIPKARTREWKLGYKMLFNPKLHCPFCEEWIESGRVWMVDEEKSTVRRVWKLDGTKINVDGSHPHVGVGGRICMGNARSVLDALVAGIAGTDDFVRAWNWFPEQLGHSCPNLERAADVGRFNRHADDPFENEDHNGEQYCDSCDEYYDEDDTYYCDSNDRTYCSNCWGADHDVCEDCDSGIHSHADETSYEVEGRYGIRRVCEECYSNRYFTCTLCDKGLRDEKYQEDGVCVECWAEDHFRCTDCAEWFELGQLDAENKCSDCRGFECSECEVRTNEVIDGKCRTCYYGTGEGQLSLLEETSDGE